MLRHNSSNEVLDIGYIYTYVLFYHYNNKNWFFVKLDILGGCLLAVLNYF